MVLDLNKFMNYMTDDYIEIERLAKIVQPTSTDLDSIWILYQRYVDPSAPMPSRTGCTTCGNSIVNYWRKLMTWWQNNKHNLIQE